MEENYSSTEALEMDLQPELSNKLQDSFSSSADSDSDDSDPDFVQTSSSSSLSFSSVSEEDTDQPESGWTAKNGLMWSPTNEETFRFVQAARGVTVGPTRYAISRCHSMDSAFCLFWTDDMIDLIVNMTNLRGRRTVKKWIDVDSTDIRVYIGLLILAGVCRSRDESTGNLWHEHKGRPIFRAAMSRNRFHDISSALHFDNELQRPSRYREDKLAPIRSLWEKWTHRLPLLFNPGRDVTVDEQLVPFKGRCRFRQYMPKKPAKYGIKIWVTADVATSYAWKCDIYLGKTGGAPEVGQGKRVVMQMTEGLQGVTVTCDNFFTSHALAQELLQRKVALVGTIRANKPELPPNLLLKKGRTVLSSLFAFTKNTTAISYVPKKGKNVILISTRHREAVVTPGEKHKPEIITYYNSCKGGVDNLDKVVGTYSCRRRTKKWPQMLFFNMVDISAYNAFVLFTAVDPAWNKAKSYRRRLFLEELGNSLISAGLQRRQRLPRTPLAAAIVESARASSAAPADTNQQTADAGSSGGKRGSCQMCTGRKKRTVCSCSRCGRSTCKDHLVLCCKSCWTA